MGLNPSQISDVRRLLRPMMRRLQLSAARAVVKLVKASGQMQLLQVATLADEVDDDVEHFQCYGFTSHPLPGAEGISISVGGTHQAVVCVDDRRHRPTDLAAGEVAIYNNAGATIVMRADGSIELTPGPGADVNVASATGTLLGIQALNQAFAAWAPAGNDGGAALKTQLAGKGWSTP